MARHRWSPACDPPRTLARPVPIDPSGLVGPTANQARGPRWRRSSRGFYVPSSVAAGLPEQRILERSVLLGPGGAVTGWAALRLASGAFFDGLEPDGRTPRPVDLVPGPGQSRRPRPGVRWHQDRLPEDEVWTRQGIRCARPERALFDEMRLSGSVRAAVVAMDMAAAADLASIGRVARYADRRRGWAGVAVVRRALALADECSRSPAETRLRLLWMLDAGRPRPSANRDVFDLEGRLLGTADLIDDEAGVVGEYDGDDHAAARRRSRDADRDTAFHDHGLEVFRVTGYDEHHPDRVVARIHSAYARALASARPRRWTLVPPPGRPAPPSLDDELDLRDLIRSADEQGDG